MSRAVLRQEKGMVLLLVLAVVALLSALLTEFAFSTLIDLRLAETYRDSTRAYYLARGGIRAGQMLLEEGSADYDARDEMWGQGVQGFPVGEGTIDITIEDLDGRLAINQLLDEMGDVRLVQKDRFTRLFEHLELEAPGDLVAALIDWLDAGDDVYNSEGLGAESDYYLGLSPSYRARNGLMTGIEELARVRGFTREVVAKIGPYVTLDGDIRVNLNTAPAEVIASSYADNAQPVSLEEAREIGAARDLTPFSDKDDFKTAFPDLWNYFQIETGGQLGHVKFTSDYYRIRSQARVNDGIRTVTAVVHKPNKRILNLRVD